MVPNYMPIRHDSSLSTKIQLMLFCKTHVFPDSCQLLYLIPSLYHVSRLADIMYKSSIFVT